MTLAANFCMKINILNNNSRNDYLQPLVCVTERQG